MKRKLVKQAGRATTITLPVEWVRENGLKPGDEVDLEINEKDLVIRSGKKAVGGTIKLRLSGFDNRIIYYYLNAIYAKGFDEIELECSVNLNHQLNQTMGFAVMCQKDDRYVIHDIGGISSENLDTIFKRVFQMILSYYDSAMDDMFGECKESITAINQIDEEINKFVLFLQRSIMKHSYQDSSGGKIMFAYSFALEKISDEILRSWRNKITLKIRNDEKLRDIFTLSRRALQKAFEIYYAPSPEKVREIKDLKESIRKQTLEMPMTNANIARFVMHALKIAEDSSDLTHLSLMKNLRG